MNSTHIRPNSHVEAPEPATVEAPKVRKQRAPKEGTTLTVTLTDPDEINTINALATADRRTPDNYLALVLYNHLKAQGLAKSGT